MRKTLEALFLGNIEISGKNVEKGTPIHKTQLEIIEKQKALNAILDADNRILLDELEDAFGRMHEQSEMDSFVEGFRLGANIMLEVLYKTDDADE